ncbi:MAG: RloB family protein [Peptococcaceae bacterium]|jgi:hypothetical protein|nr:RloB family protein [Peptococcaceae bacterium]
MTERKRSRKYHFTVEGETEQWYFQWLQEAINNEPSAVYKVKIICNKSDPVKYVKSINVIQKTEITHVFDYEGNEPQYEERFKKTLSKMKAAATLGRQVKYRLGYSNFSFELWMVLHKMDCNKPYNHRNQYIQAINHAYGKSFENLGQYKHERNFRYVLASLSLEDVKHAIRRAIAVTEHKRERGDILQQYKGYTFYCNNPSLSIWESIQRILSDCGLYAE